MAQRTEIILIDDIDGGSADETVEFGLDGVTYEIDLSDKNAAKFRQALSLWTGSGRRTGGKKKRAGVATASTSTSRTDRNSYLKDLREWAKGQNLQVSERGRIPAEIEAAYEAHLSAG